MKERPILFSAPMVRALLAGTKTQTRRVMARQKQHAFTEYTLFGQRGHPDDEAARRGSWERPWVAVEHAPDWPDGQEDRCYCPYARERGDRLWVRESYSGPYELTGTPPRDWIPGTPVWYWADGNPTHVDLTKPKPGMHMPRWASRILLEVTEVRVERLQDISEADARAEGAPPSHPSIDRISREFGYEDFPRSWYAQLWEQINGPGSWTANPWVWVVEFRRIQA